MHQGYVLVLFSVLAAIAAVFVMKNEENDVTENTGGTTGDFLPEVAPEEQAGAARWQAGLL